MSSPDDVEEADEVNVNAGRLWAGGLATALVAALVVVAGVFIAHAALGIQVASGRGDLSTAEYAGLAACSALVATALLHILLLAAPRPLAFFGWITALVAVVAAVVPFTEHGSLSIRICTAIINVVVSVAVISLLSAVGRSAAYSAGEPEPDLGQPSQRPENNYERPGGNYEY